MGVTQSNDHLTFTDYVALRERVGEWNIGTWNVRRLNTAHLLGHYSDTTTLLIVLARNAGTGRVAR